MKKYTALIAILALPGMAGADSFNSLGYVENTIIQSGTDQDCCGIPFDAHDQSFENGYCWQLEGTTPPYYGAFGEGFDLGDGYVTCGRFYLTQVGYYAGAPLDAYVWNGGVTGAPGSVRCVAPGFGDLDIGFWPTCTLNEVPIGCAVSGEFTVGYWADFSQGTCEWYLCADENGFGNNPWTCVAPGIGYPTGWQHPSVIWPGCVTLGLGLVLNDQPSPAESQTWGSIKALFE